MSTLYSYALLPFKPAYRRWLLKRIARRLASEVASALWLDACRKKPGTTGAEWSCYLETRCVQETHPRVDDLLLDHPELTGLEATQLIVVSAREAQQLIKAAVCGECPAASGGLARLGRRLSTETRRTSSSAKLGRMTILLHQLF